MCATTMLLLAALPTLAGRVGWCVDGEVSVVQEPAGVRVAALTGPTFAPRQRTSVVAPVGHAATLDCSVLRLHDKSVSWVRSRDLQILSHAGVVFTADARVSATSADGAEGMDGASGTSRHTLHIERLRTSDAGHYECQVNTEPKMSLFFNLTVVDEPVPSVVVSALGVSSVSAPLGGAATLACEARYSPAPRRLPLPPLDVRWMKDDEPLTLQGGRGGRGGVALDTQRWVARVESRLTLADLAPEDEGAYTCAAADHAATITLRLYPDEDRAEAMQRDQAGGAAAGSTPAAPARGWLTALLPSLLALLALHP